MIFRQPVYPVNCFSSLLSMCTSPFWHLFFLTADWLPLTNRVVSFMCYFTGSESIFRIHLCVFLCVSALGSVAGVGRGIAYMCGLAFVTPPNIKGKKKKEQTNISQNDICSSLSSVCDLTSSLSLLLFFFSLSFFFSYLSLFFFFLGHG